MPIADSRFDTSQWSKSKKASTSNGSDEEREPDDEEMISQKEEEIDEEEDDDDDDDDEAEPSTLTEEERIVKPLSKEELARFEARQQKRGIIYISRIPIGMTVPKVRHLLSGFGEVERIYLQDGRAKERGDAAPKMSRRAAKSAHFTEGWVEFKEKRVAKAVAEMLNAEPIGAASGGSGGGKGGKRAGGSKSFRRWKDEIWTMKYLSGFKWNMLSEQLANERAARASRVRAELAQSSFEQKDYLQKVERARVMRDKEARQQARQAKAQATTASGETSTTSVRTTTGDIHRPHEHTFKQRQAITKDVREQRGAKRNHVDNASDLTNKRTRPSTKQDEDRSKALQGALTKIF